MGSANHLENKIKLVESFSINGKNAKVKTGLGTPAIVYKFDSGHKYTKYMDGSETFLSRNGERTLNQRTDTKLIAEMRALAAGGIQ